ncbi:uncharacterized protein [Misgurnus anguillicaudatus]|uniref:uncharacterized protein isoform X2 n=1 Tax=Misgurnus anguillicaudatus TaxID=75329 RepID=UPI003CCF30DE
MTTAGLRIGDQVVLEEDYDENYIPSEQEIHEYAVEIGIDPEREPELLWLAREGMVAPLPAEWKPCQDVTGEVYYFNFSTGQSTWDHPCDEQYRQLVILERERAQQARTLPAASGLGTGKKDKEKKKKKEKKDKKKEKKKDLESLRAPVLSGPLAPIRGLSDGSLRGSLGSLQPLKTSLGGVLVNSSAVVSCQEEKSADEETEEERLRDSGGLLRNLHLDLDALGGLQYEDSEVSETVPPEERTEPELQDLALSRDHSLDAPVEGSLRGCHLPSGPPGGSREHSSVSSCPPTPGAAVSGGREDEMSDRNEGAQEEVELKRGDEEENGKSDRDGEEIEEQIERFSSPEDNERDQAEDRSDERDQIVKRSDDEKQQGVVKRERSYSQSDQTEEKSEVEKHQREERLDDEHKQTENKCDSMRIEMRHRREEMNESEKEDEKSVSSVEEECGERDEEEQSDTDDFRNTDVDTSEHMEETHEDTHVQCLDHQPTADLNDSPRETDSKHLKTSHRSSGMNSDREEIEHLEVTRPETQKTNIKSDTRKFVPQWNPVSSEESEAGEPVQSLSSTDDVQRGFVSKFSENVFDLLELSPAVESKDIERVSKDANRCLLDDVTSAQIPHSPDNISHRPTTAHDRSDISAHREGDETDQRESDESEQTKGERQDTDRQTALEENSDEEEERDRQMQEDRRRLMEEKDRRLQLLRDTLMEEEKEEERRMKEESAEQLRLLKERLLKERREEEEKLTHTTHTQLKQLRDESEVKLRELRSELEAERDRVETENRRSLDHLRAESEEGLRAEKKRLQEKKEEQLSSIRLEAKLSDRQKDLRSPRPEKPLAEYQRELTDVLQEVREEVERDHRRKLEQLKEKHQHELQNLRETHLEQENRERERLLNCLQEERDDLISKHTTQLHKLQNMLDTQLQETHKTHSQKESVLHDLIKKLELQSKEIQTQEAELQAKESVLRKKRQQLCEEDDDIQREVQSLPRLMKENQELHDELQREREERERARCTMMKEREQLEKRLIDLQERCQQLTCRVSELEEMNAASRMRDGEEEKEKKKKMKKKKSENHLRLEDLEASACSGESDISVDGVRQYMWNESVSLLRARQFLEKQDTLVSDRQAALQAAHSSLKDPMTESSAQQLYQNLQQEVKDLSELRETLQKGQTLLKEKEEKLNLLETSLTEEVSGEDGERSADRKVTFDVTESEMSSVYGHEGTVPVKVQQLADSLQLISGQLNSVLGALGSLTQKPNPPSLISPQVLRSSWAWPINSSPSLLQHRPTDMMHTTWSSLNTETSRAHMTNSSLSSLRPSAEVEGHRLQGLIDGNKRWLEAQRKNRNIPLFPNLRNTSSGLLQLSLDDNNQIKVHRY